MEVLLPYGEERQHTLFGSVWLPTEWKEALESHKFYVLKDICGALLSFQTCLSFWLVKIVHQMFSIADSILSCFLGQENLRTNMYKSMLMRPLNHPINEAVKSWTQSCWMTIFLSESRMNLHHGFLLSCVSPKYPEEIGMCVDMRKAKECTIREYHQMPTIDELVHDYHEQSCSLKPSTRIPLVVYGTFRSLNHSILHSCQNIQTQAPKVWYFWHIKYLWRSNMTFDLDPWGK